jgi:hypothetical protein
MSKAPHRIWIERAEFYDTIHAYASPPDDDDHPLESLIAYERADHAEAERVAALERARVAELRCARMLAVVNAAKDWCAADTGPETLDTDDALRDAVRALARETPSP